MKELAEANDNADALMNGYDNLTGLRLFMVSAMGEKHDLSTIYGMMRMSPEIDNTELYSHAYDGTSRNKRRRVQ